MDLFNSSELTEGRTQRLQLAASQRKWHFLKEATFSSLIPNFKRFSLFNAGNYLSRARMCNLLYQDGSHLRIAIFDYEYHQGSSSSGGHYTQTVGYLSSSRLALPYFNMTPNTSVRGLRDIEYTLEFSNWPVFNANYLIGGNIAGIQQTFSHRVLSFFESNPGWTIEGGDNELLFLRHDVLVVPEQMQPFIDWSFEVFNLFREARHLPDRKNQ